MPFDPMKHLMQIKGKEYLEVKWRIVWFKTEHPEGSIETEIAKETDRGVTFKATVSYPLVNTQNDYHSPYHLVVGTGHAFEPWERKDRYGGAHENAETSAIGRAMAAIGYGTQFAPEYEDSERIVDSPVQRNAGASQPSAPRRNESAPHPAPSRPSTAPPRSSGADDTQQSANISSLIAAYRQGAATAERPEMIRDLWKQATADGSMAIPEVAYAIVYHSTRLATSQAQLEKLMEAAVSGDFGNDAEFLLQWNSRKTYLEQTQPAGVRSGKA